MATLEQMWTSLAGSDVLPAHTRVSSDHPLELFAQIDVSRRPGLLALSDSTFDKPPTYSAVETFVGHRDDGRWALSMSLAQSALAAHFTVMCEQIIEQGRARPAGSCAATFLLSQVARWHRLLALGPDGLLAAEDQQGLFGELLVLAEACSTFGVEVALAAWVGPDEAPRDFALPTMSVEVKTMQAGNATISISSLDQLDSSQQPLMLAVVEIIRCAPGTGGQCLFEAVAQTRALVAASPQATVRFEEQLGKAGYVDRDEYKAPEYRVARTSWYDVRSGFPRLARSALPSAIRDARYQLLVSALKTFETNAFAADGRP